MNEATMGVGDEATLGVKSFSWLFRGLKLGSLNEDVATQVALNLANPYVAHSPSLPAEKEDMSKLVYCGEAPRNTWSWGLAQLAF